VGFSPDGRTVAAANHGEGETHQVRLFDVRAGLAQGSFEVESAYPRQLTFSPDGRYLAVTSGNNVKVMNLPRFIGGPPPVETAELSGLWDDLDNADVGVAYRAYWRMVLAGSDAVCFLRDKLPPVREVSPDHLRHLIKELGNAHYAIRHKATQALEGHGESAGGALRAALAGSSPLETRRRIESLLARQFDLRRDRAVQILETVGSPPARILLEEIAAGMANAQLSRNAKASLDRLGNRVSSP